MSSPTSPRVFISYSHDNRAHCDAVLALAQQLRHDGIAAELDQFHQEELLHWPSWCEEQMRPENADFVLCICTAEYRSRVENRAAADVGKGVFWEGRRVYNEIYRNKGNHRFVPVLLAAATDTDIPEMLDGYTGFKLDSLGLADTHSAYAKLYRLLTGQPGTSGAVVGATVALPSLPVEERQTDFMTLMTAGFHRINSKLDQLPQLTAQAVAYQFNARSVANRLRDEIEQRFQADLATAHQAGKNYEAIIELEKNRDAALNRVDDIVSFIEQGLAGTPDPIFKEATKLLELQGSDAALGYLESRRAKILANADQYAQQAEAAEEKLHDSLRPLLLEAEIREGRQEWEAALKLLQTVAEKAPHWWYARTELGSQLRNLARYTEAESHLRDAVSLAVDEKDQASALNSLALLLQDTNRFAEGEPLMRRALAIYEKSYGPEHPNVAAALNNLATLLNATNRLADAEPLMRRALAIDEKSYGTEHPAVAIDLNNLATLMYATNRLAEAEPLMRRALAIDEKSYGPEHPMVAIRLNNLALLLKDTNRLAEAEPVMRRVVVVFEKSYGADHPDVATALNNLALVLQATNRLAEAEPLMRRHLIVYLKFTRVTGHEHPNLWQAITNYQQLLIETGLKPTQITQRLAEIGQQAGYTAEEWHKLLQTEK